MKFETSKVIYDSSTIKLTEENAGKEFYFSDYILDLSEIVEHETVDFRGYVVGIDDSDVPFSVKTADGDIRYARLLYPAEGKVIKKYRPYENKNELYDDVYKRQPKTIPVNARPLTWIMGKGNGNVLLITGYLSNGILADDFYSFEELFEKFEYLDGTPCGVRL